MPTTKFQEIVFGLMMSVTMVYGMQVYNACLRHGGISVSSFFIPIDEMVLLTLIVFVIQTWVGVPLAKKLAFSFMNPKVTSRFLFTLTLSIFTVISMCPIMSMVATLMFKGIDSHVLTKWLGAFSLNLPMAFVWQIFIAGPLVRYLFKVVFVEKSELQKDSE